MELSTPLEKVFRLMPKQKSALQKLGLTSIEDLVNHLPYRYEDPADFKYIKDVVSGEDARIWGKVIKIDYEKTWKKKINIAYATIEDQTGKIKAVWFRQPYIAKMLPEGSCAIFAGKVSIRKGSLYIANPTYEPVPCNIIPNFSKTTDSRLVPLYPSSMGVSSLWMQKSIHKILAQGIVMAEFLPQEILERYHLPDRNTAIRIIHTPKTVQHAEVAKKRFAFENVFLIQLSRMLQKEEIKKCKTNHIENIKTLAQEFESLLPFSMTNAQKKAVEDIIRDFQSGSPMNRLLEGDVGSGKTAVAACAAYIIAKNRLQAAYMAPTEILARQHFDGFCKLFGHSNIKIGLLTSSFTEKFPSKIDPHGSTHISRAQLLKWAREGEFQILIGTHAVIQKKVVFKNLALAMVDEQHRFGVFQRSKLRKKDSIEPHFLSMSATPIPRTLALAIYADLDLSVIDELPPGRKYIETKLVRPNGRNEIYQFIRDRVIAGEQVFVICPRISKPDEADTTKLEMKSVKEEYKKLKENIFPEFTISMMHGKLTPKEKESVMREFKEGKSHIMVSTSVVEVGVDVPNATIMMIEGAERFGLAQLHQFRGRVGRGEKQSYCFLFPQKYSANIFRRLKALTEAKTGFELAEYDLQFRGAGELSGSSQSGISDIGMEALQNLKMVEAARLEAKNIIESKSIEQYPLLQQKVIELQSEPIHLE